MEGLGVTRRWGLEKWAGLVCDGLPMPMEGVRTLFWDHWGTFQGFKQKSERVCVCVDTHIYLKISIELMVGYNGEREPEVLEPLSNYLENLGVQLAKMIIQALIWFMGVGGQLELTPGWLYKFRCVLKFSIAPEGWLSQWLSPGISGSIP